MATKAAVSRVVDTFASGGTLKSALEQVSAETGISMAALRMAYHRFPSGLRRLHGTCTLRAHEDDVLLGVAQAFSLNNFPLSGAPIRAVVKRRWDKDVSKPWVTRWVRRQRHQLSLRTCKALSDKRAGPEDLKGTKAFCGELETLLEFHSFIPASMFNYDETRVTQTGGMLVVKRIEARGKARSNASTTRKATAASLLTFVLASGDVFMSVYVMKAKFGYSDAVPVDFCLHEAPRSSWRCWPRFYCWSKTGYLDGELFGAVMDNFVAEWEVRNPGVPAILFGDQLGVHRQPDVV